MSCQKNGDCCSDYKLCEKMEEIKNTNCKVSNCQYCNDDGNLCLQCIKGFLYNFGSCVENCPKGTIRNEMVCQNQECDGIKNCEECEGKICKKCVRGLYLYENNCLSKCPNSLIANRIDFTCIELSFQPHYWISPSSGSCKGKCGNNSNENDCSCNDSCLQKGDCCDDFKENCKSLIKKGCNLCENGFCLEGKCQRCKINTIANEGKCYCIKDFINDRENDLCVSNNSKKNTNSNTNGTNEIENLININDFGKRKGNSKKNYLSKTRDETNKSNTESQNQLNIEKMVLTKSQKLIDEISKDFHENKDLDNQVNKMEDSIYKDSNLNLYLHGNQNLNLLNNNIKTKILNNTVYNQNSFNSRNNTISNFDSYNVIKKIKTSGEIKKSINHGSINVGNTGKKYSKSNMQNKHLNGRRKIDIDSNPYYQHNKLLGNDEKLSLNADPPRFEKGEPEVKSSPNKNLTNTYSKPTNEAPQDKSKLKPYNSPEVNIKEVRNNNIYKKTTHSNESNNTLRNETSKNQSCDKKNNSENQENSVGLKRGLIVGNSNVVRDNKIINNIIHVHNNYVLAGKGLNLTNSTSLIKQEVYSKIFPNENIIQIDHNGLIIRGNFSIKLCEKIQNGVCLKCKNNTVEKIGGCECKQNYTYNVTADSCDKLNVFSIVVDKNYTKSVPTLKKHVQNITKLSELKCNEGFFFNKELKKCVKVEKKFVNSQQKISVNVSCSVNLCEKCKNGLCKKCVKHSVYSNSINECECKKGYRQKGNICKSKFNIKEGKKHKHMNLCIKYSSENICQKCKIHSYLNEKKNICKCRKDYHYNKHNNECESK
jgi:hypothetical protein